MYFKHSFVAACPIRVSRCLAAVVGEAEVPGEGDVAEVGKFDNTKGIKQ